jgi:hypothetical protein
MAWDQLAQFFASCALVKWSLPLAGAGLMCLWLDKSDADRRFIVTTLLGFSVLAFAAAFYFSRHYFIVMLPVVSLLIAIAGTTAAGALAGKEGAMRRTPAALFALACGAFIWGHRAVWFQISPEAACRDAYRENPFVESVEIARYIREHSAPDARIAILGSEPQIFFYAHRRSASGFIYAYDLVQTHRYASQFQREMIAEAAKPQFLVLVQVSSSWLNWPGADNTLARWGAAYIARFYRQAGTVYIYPARSDYVWGPESANERSDTKFLVEVYTRTEK